MNRVWWGDALIELTAVEDGRSHRVDIDAYGVGLTSGTGRYRTLCGRSVLAASMITAPGPGCRECRRIARDAEWPDDPRRDARLPVGRGRDR
jgi:hypothetical protein